MKGLHARSTNQTSITAETFIVGGYKSIEDIPSEWPSSEPFLGCKESDWVQDEVSEAEGKIAIIGRGECYYWEKVMMAYKYGAVGVVVVNK